MFQMASRKLRHKESTTLSKASRILIEIVSERFEIGSRKLLYNSIQGKWDFVSRKIIENCCTEEYNSVQGKQDSD